MPAAVLALPLTRPPAPPRRRGRGIDPATHPFPCPPSAAVATVEIVSLQREASSMPDWAAYKAHMDMGFRLSAKQR